LGRVGKTLLVITYLTDGFAPGKSIARRMSSPRKGGSGSSDKEPAVSHEQRIRVRDKGFCVLSLDGGGCRGYISLLTLRHLLRQLQREGPIYPYLYFDLICGTSTGGLITILLAVLHLDIDTALQLYYRLVGQVFAKDFSVLRYLLKDAGYSRRPLERAITEILQNHGHGRTLMIDASHDRGCRVSHFY
jgi:predicted acylesterase/phospholipase RssA